MTEENEHSGMIDAAEAVLRTVQLEFALCHCYTPPRCFVFGTRNPHTGKEGDFTVILSAPEELSGREALEWLIDGLPKVVRRSAGFGFALISEVSGENGEPDSVRCSVQCTGCGQQHQWRARIDPASDEPQLGAFEREPELLTFRRLLSVPALREKEPDQSELN